LPEKSSKQVFVLQQSKEVCLNVQTSEKCPVQVSVYNLICSQFTEIDANQSQKKGKRLKFDIQLACVAAGSFPFLFLAERSNKRASEGARLG